MNMYVYIYIHIYKIRKIITGLLNKINYLESMLIRLLEMKGGY